MVCLFPFIVNHACMKRTLCGGCRAPLACVLRCSRAKQLHKYLCRCTGDDGNRGTSFDPFSVYASAHGQATTPQPQTMSLSERLAAYTADVPSPMTAADLAIGHAAAAAGRTVAHADDAVPAAGAMFNSGDLASERRSQGEEAPCKKRLAPPPVPLSDKDCGPSAIYVPASGAAAAAAAAATREVLGPAESGTFSPSQQQRLMQPYAGAAAVAPPPSNLPQPSSSFASGSFSRRGSPAAAAGAALSGLPSASDPNSHLMGPPAPVQQPDITQTGAQQQQMGISAGDAQPGAHFGVPLSTEQLLNRLHGSTERQAAQLPGRSYGQGGGVYGAGLPMPPPASGLPSESRLFSNADAGVCLNELMVRYCQAKWIKLRMLWHDNIPSTDMKAYEFTAKASPAQ